LQGRYLGLAVAQAVSRWLPTAAARFRVPVEPLELLILIRKIQGSDLGVKKNIKSCFPRLPSKFQYSTFKLGHYGFISHSLRYRLIALSFDAI
jgi:hypothetical protein